MPTQVDACPTSDGLFAPANCSTTTKCKNGKAWPVIQHSDVSEPSLQCSASTAWTLDFFTSATTLSSHMVYDECLADELTLIAAVLKGDTATDAGYLLTGGVVHLHVSNAGTCALPIVNLLVTLAQTDGTIWAVSGYENATLMMIPDNCPASAAESPAHICDTLCDTPVAYTSGLVSVAQNSSKKKDERDFTVVYGFLVDSARVEAARDLTVPLEFNVTISVTFDTCCKTGDEPACGIDYNCDGQFETVMTSSVASAPFALNLTTVAATPASICTDECSQRYANHTVNYTLTQDSVVLSNEQIHVVATTIIDGSFWSNFTLDNSSSRLCCDGIRQASVAVPDFDTHRAFQVDLVQKACSACVGGGGAAAVEEEEECVVNTTVTFACDAIMECEVGPWVAMAEYNCSVPSVTIYSTRDILVQPVNTPTPCPALNATETVMLAYGEWSEWTTCIFLDTYAFKRRERATLNYTDCVTYNFTDALAAEWSDWSECINGSTTRERVIGLDCPTSVTVYESAPCQRADYCETVADCSASATQCASMQCVANSCTLVPNVTCPAPLGLCYAPVCNPETGMCEDQGLINCDDNNTCTTDSCDTFTGTCLNVQRNFSAGGICNATTGVVTFTCPEGYHVVKPVASDPTIALCHPNCTTNSECEEIPWDLGDDVGKCITPYCDGSGECQVGTLLCVGGLCDPLLGYCEPTCFFTICPPGYTNAPAPNCTCILDAGWDCKSFNPCDIATYNYTTDECFHTPYECTDAANVCGEYVCQPSTLNPGQPQCLFNQTVPYLTDNLNCTVTYCDASINASYTIQKPCATPSSPCKKAYCANGQCQEIDLCAPVYPEDSCFIGGGCNPLTATCNAIYPKSGCCTSLDQCNFAGGEICHVEPNRTTGRCLVPTYTNPFACDPSTPAGTDYCRALGSISSCVKDIYCGAQGICVTELCSITALGGSCVAETCLNGQCVVVPQSTYCPPAPIGSTAICDPLYCPQTNDHCLYCANDRFNLGGLSCTCSDGSFPATILN